MIRVIRPTSHPALEQLAPGKLSALRALLPAPTSKDIDGYQIASSQLWRGQHYKCCYCEFKICCSYNDVEHYRPKASANRLPGCSKTGGYWWLAYSISNLLFACPSCNRSSKNDRFPLLAGSASLGAEELPPGNEVPLLIDPAGDVNPVEHIEFAAFEINRVDRCYSPMTSDDALWMAIPRAGSLFGRYTIEVVNLNRSELLELRSDYVRREIRPKAKQLLDVIEKGHAPAIQDAADRANGLLAKSMPFTALSLDALNCLVPNLELTQLARRWPTPAELG